MAQCIKFSCNIYEGTSTKGTQLWIVIRPTNISDVLLTLSACGRKTKTITQQLNGNSLNETEGDDKGLNYSHENID